MSHFICAALSFFLFLLSVSFAAPPENWKEWQEAQTFFQSKKYKDALDELNKHPKENAAYYYNIGTIYFYLNQIGLSVAYLEKANTLQLHDADIQYNLSVSRLALEKQIGAAKVDPASSWTEQVADRISLDEVRATLGLMGIIVTLLWARAYSNTRSIRKAFLEPAGLLGLLGFALTVGIYGLQQWTAVSPPAVSLSRQTIRSGPGDHYLELGQLESGTKIRLLGPSSAAQGNEKEIWRQVRFSEEGIGWVRATSILPL